MRFSQGTLDGHGDQADVGRSNHVYDENSDFLDTR